MPSSPHPLRSPRADGPLPRVLVKVCGVTRATDARMLAQVGVDAVGVIFASGSRRRVSLDAAEAVLAALPPQLARVGVFAAPTLSELVGVVAALAERAVPLDVVQLHGRLPVGFEGAVGAPLALIRALRWTPALRVAQALEPPFAALLIDGPEAGSGVGFDWGAAHALRGGDNWVLAGGLRPENVAAAVAQLDPPAVDVASGVEAQPGVKDPARVMAFLAALRSSHSG